ncbi:2'-5' RNA ligase family protein [Mycobacterium hackensackense]|uniref:2'-5' RNA ligase family protein n=1 Tax=Mycobacterium hackensackense TaxID=228909 RepID=UPI0022659A15|nr:2'-5' RNA ligase family protein [Mycobacterium hackensackense]MCV7256481.1 2'-5' RNA ligase family protein [Mycobacterium hackensackense]
MAHSVELLLDPETDAAIRGVWEALAEKGIRSQAAHRGPSNRPHVTMTVSAGIAGDVDPELSAAATALPLSCRIGAPVLFGRGPFTLARLVVPRVELLELHADIYRICLPHMPSGAFAHAVPGHWTPHVTLARRVDAAQLDRAMPLAGADIDGTLVRLRRWDGDARSEYPIG